MKIIPAERTKEMTYAIRDVVVEAQKLKRQGMEILHLNIGDPMKFDYATPRHMIEAIERNWHKSSGYAESKGIVEAREAISNEANRNGLKHVSSDDVRISNGGSESISIVLGALLNKGDDFLSPSPNYPLYGSLTSYFSCKFNDYLLDEENDWQPDLDSIRKNISERTKALLMINPNNPTGAVYKKSTVQGMIDIAGEHNIPIISDETYDKLILDDDEMHHPAAALSDDVPVVTINSLSKSYLVPGWRAGWSMISDPEGMLDDVQEAIDKISRSRLCSCHPCQYAIKPALEGPQDHIEEVKKKLRHRRDITFKRLNAMDGISCIKPKGAFYAFPKIEKDIDDKEFVLGLLRKTGVLTVFGSGFRDKPGTKHFRTVFLPKPDVLNTSFDKMEEFLREY